MTETPRGLFFFLQATIMLDNFTIENGATAVIPGSQRIAEYPWDAEEFARNQEQVLGK